MSPSFIPIAGDHEKVEGTVTFGRYFLGGGGAVHGGAIPLLFDEVLGRLASSGDRAPARTAYLHTDFRSITPVGVELAVRAWFVSEQGRKRTLRAQLTHGDTLCAEAEGLFIELRPISHDQLAPIGRAVLSTAPSTLNVFVVQPDQLPQGKPVRLEHRRQR